MTERTPEEEFELMHELCATANRNGYEQGVADTRREASERTAVTYLSGFFDGAIMVLDRIRNGGIDESEADGIRQWFTEQRENNS